MGVDSGPFAGRELALRLRPAEWRVTDLTFRFLIDSEEGPLPGVEALDVPPAVLLHPAVPQPDGERMYELLTRHIRRDPGCLVYLCDITDELDLAFTTWYRLGIGWQEVIDTLADLAAADEIPARRMLAPIDPQAETGRRSAPPVPVAAASRWARLTRRAWPSGRRTRSAPR